MRAVDWPVDFWLMAASSETRRAAPGLQRRPVLAMQKCSTPGVPSGNGSVPRSGRLLQLCDASGATEAVALRERHSLLGSRCEHEVAAFGVATLRTLRDHELDCATNRQRAPASMQKFCGNTHGNEHGDTEQELAHNDHSLGQVLVLMLPTGSSGCGSSGTASCCGACRCRT